MKTWIMVAALAIGLFSACNTTKKTTSTTSSKEEVKIEKEVVVVKETAPESKPARPGTETPGTIQFKAENARYKADGTFKNWHFTELNFGKDGLVGFTGRLVIDVNSVSEKADGLTNHLKQADFLDVAKHNEAQAEIGSVERVEGDKYKAMITLTIKGVSQKYPATFEVTNKEPFHVKGECEILRLPYGLGGEGNINNEVKILFDTDLK